MYVLIPLAGFVSDLQQILPEKAHHVGQPRRVFGPPGLTSAELPLKIFSLARLRWRVCPTVPPRDLVAACSGFVVGWSSTSCILEHY